MATLHQHFERLSDALDEAREMEDREAAAEFLVATARSIRETPRNQALRIWFLKAALEAVGVSEADVDAHVAA